MTTACALLALPLKDSSHLLRLLLLLCGCHDAVLRYNLFDSQVDGLRRFVSGRPDEEPVAAWRHALLLPFYVLDEEQAATAQRAEVCDTLDSRLRKD